MLEPSSWQWLGSHRASLDLWAGFSGHNPALVGAVVVENCPTAMSAGGNLPRPHPARTRGNETQGATAGRRPGITAQSGHSAASGCRASVLEAGGSQCAGLGSSSFPDRSRILRARS